MADVVINVGAVSAITAGTGLTGGTITGTGTIAADFGTTAGTICQGNDARLTAPVAPLAHASTHTAAGSDPLTLSQSQITSLSTDLAAKVATTRQVIAGTGMGGGGALSADVTLNVSYGSSGTTACVGNDARLSNDRTPSTHASTHATGGTDVLTLGQAQITGLVTALSNKALGATVMTAGTGLTGGGDLSAGRTFAVAYGTTSTTATVGNDARLSFLAAGTGATSRTLQNKLRDVVSVKDFGAVGDGATDDRVAIQAAINSAMTLGNAVYFPAGVYVMSTMGDTINGAQIFGVLTNDVSLVGDGATIKCTSSTQVAFMFCFYSGSYNINLEGLRFDANQKAQVCFKKIETVQGGSSVYVNNCEFSNSWRTLLGAPASPYSPIWFSNGGLQLFGGFKFVSVTASKFLNHDRQVGSNNPATTGMVIAEDLGSLTYPQNTNISGNLFDTITNNETTSATLNINCDGLVVFGGLTYGSTYIPSSATITNNQFVNCKGRAVKVQADESIITNNVIRFASLAIYGGFVLINPQITSGVVSQNIFHFDVGPGGVNPFDTSGTGASGTTGGRCVLFYEGVVSTRPRMFTVDGNMVFNNVPEATGVLYSFSEDSEATESTYPLFGSITNNKITGPMKIFARITTRSGGSSGVCSHDISGNMVSKLVSAFLASSTSSNFEINRLSVNSNTNAGTAVPQFVNTSDYTTIMVSNTSALRNYNIGLAADLAFINNAGQSFLPRIGSIVDPDSSFGGAVSVQSISVASEGSYAFPRRSYFLNGASMRMLTSDIGGTGNFLFLHGSSTITSVSAGAAIDFASTTNPNTADRINVWIDTSTGLINIKNRKSFALKFTLFTLG